MILSSEEIIDFLNSTGVVAQFSSIALPVPIASYFNTKRLHDATNFNLDVEENNFFAITESNMVKNVAVGEELTTEDNVFKYTWRVQLTPEPLMNGFTKITLQKILVEPK